MSKRDFQSTQSAVRSYTLEESDFRQKEVKEKTIQNRKERQAKQPLAIMASENERHIRVVTKLWARFAKAGKAENKEAKL